MSLAGPGMSAGDLRLWAKEEVLSAIDQHLLSDDGWKEGLDEELAVLRERDRIAKFLGLAHLKCPYRERRAA